MNLRISNKALSLYVVVSIIFTVFSYFYIDIWLNTFIQQNLNNTIKNVAESITELGNAKYYYIALIIMLIYFGLIKKNKKLFKQINFLLLIMLTTTLITYTAKFIIGRNRPNIWLNEGKYEFNPFYFENTYDFTAMPSGHSQTSFTVAIILSIFFPKYKYIFIAIAIISGFSRVILSAHWLGDIVIGAVFWNSNTFAYL